MLESLNVFWHLAACVAALWAAAQLLGLQGAKREWEQAVLPVLLEAVGPAATRSHLLRAARYLLTHRGNWGRGVTWQVVWSAASIPGDSFLSAGCAREALVQLFALVEGTTVKPSVRSWRSAHPMSPAHRLASERSWLVEGKVLGTHELLGRLEVARHVALTLAFVGGGAPEAGVYWEVRGLRPAGAGTHVL